MVMAAIRMTATTDVSWFAIPQKKSHRGKNTESIKPVMIVAKRIVVGTLVYLVICRGRRR